MLDIIFFLYGDCDFESRKIRLAKIRLKPLARHIAVYNPLMKKYSRHFPGGRKN